MTKRHCIFRTLQIYRQQSSSASFEKIITKDDVDNFAKFSGDNNHIHFGTNAIVHGALLNAFVSAVIGTRLPGHGTIVASQKMKFPNPCYCGDSVIITVEIEKEKRKLTKCLYKVVKKSDNSIVMEGDALLVLPKGD